MREDIKTEILKHIEDGIKIEISRFPNKEEIHLRYSSKNAKSFMEKKAILDNLSKMLTEDGYKITYSNIDLDDILYYQSITLEKEENK